MTLPHLHPHFGRASALTKTKNDMDKIEQMRSRIQVLEEIREEQTETIEELKDENERLRRAVREAADKLDNALDGEEDGTHE